MYGIILLETNHYYIGSEYKFADEVANPENLWTSYFTHSKFIETLIAELGETAFQAYVIQEFENAEDTLRFEKALIDANINNPLNLNFHNGGGFKVGKYNDMLRSGVIVSPMKGKKLVDIVGSKMAEKLIKELGDRMKDKATVKDKDGNQFKVSINDPRFLSKELVGINSGTTRSLETRQRQSATMIGVPKTEEHCRNKQGPQRQAKISKPQT